jgi:hypothetical protein
MTGFIAFHNSFTESQLEMHLALPILIQLRRISLVLKVLILGYLCFSCSARDRLLAESVHSASILKSFDS